MKTTINLDETASTTILAGLLDISQPAVYQFRHQGKLPPDENATYRQCLTHHIDYLKNKARRKVADAFEQQTLQQIRLGIAKEQQIWLDIKEKRKELIDKELFLETIAPIFSVIKTGLVALTREFPETTEKVDTLISNWQSLGTQLVAEANVEGEKFVSNMLTKKIDLVEDSEIEGLNIDV